MPTYLPKLHGVRLSEALAEAAAIAPVQRAILHTFELWHMTLAEPVYVVNDYADLLAYIEQDASRNALTQVTFLACNVKISRPEESDSAAAPEVTLTVDNVSGVFSSALRLSRGWLEPWEIIERLYASDDLTSPALLPPLKLHVVSVDLTGQLATLHCRHADFTNYGVPRLTFNRHEYPGLDFQ
jgi:hypothetical protein